MFEKRDPPIQQVRMMKAQGYSNNQIIQALQRDGLSSSQIFDALNSMEQVPAPPEAYAPSPPPPMPEPQMPQGPQQENVEELVEAIIDEKWNDLMKDINKIIDWKNKVENRMTQLEQSFQDLKDNFDKVHGAIIGKVSEYDKNILEVGAELKAMEKVFSKVLPSFTDNVNELSRITDALKKK